MPQFGRGGFVMIGWLALATLGACARGTSEPMQRDAGEVERRMRAVSAGGRELVLSSTEGTHIFNNDASRFCYTYMIPGKWVPGDQPSAYRSAEGRAIVGVLFVSTRDLEAAEGPDLGVVRE
jgi:hypothetical protein